MNQQDYFRFVILLGAVRQAIAYLSQIDDPKVKIAVNLLRTALVGEKAKP